MTASLHPQTTRPGGFFITGTDTEIGKTYVSCCIAHTLKHIRPDLDIYPRKPIASGAIEQDNKLISEDALFLQQASKTKDSLETICPYRFKAAISPQRAIQQSGKPIKIDNLVNACQTPKNGFTLVEGAGGFYSPLAPDGLNKDLANNLGYPVILVVGNRLGCINHALLTVEAIERQQLQLAAIIVNDCDAQADFNNYTDLKNFLSIPILHLAYSEKQQLQKIHGLENFLYF